MPLQFLKPRSGVGLRWLAAVVIFLCAGLSGGLLFHRLMIFSPAEIPTPALDTPEGNLDRSRVLQNATPKLLAWQRHRIATAKLPAVPLVAVIVSGLGLDTAAAQAVMAHLPERVAVSFSPYTRDLPALIALAQEQGREVFSDLLFVPRDYPNNDLGPLALLRRSDADEDSKRLSEFRTRGAQSVGFVVPDASAFLDAPGVARARFLLRDFAFEGYLLLLPPLLAEHIPFATALESLSVDRPATSPDGVDQQLASLERLARHHGGAIAVAQSYPSSLEQITLWTRSLAGRGVALAHPTAVYERLRKSLPASEDAP